MKDTYVCAVMGIMNEFLRCKLDTEYMLRQYMSIKTPPGVRPLTEQEVMAALKRMETIDIPLVLVEDQPKLLEP